MTAVDATSEIHGKVDTEATVETPVNFGRAPLLLWGQVATATWRTTRPVHKQEILMLPFIARIVENVLGENGQTSEVCQTMVELEARNAREADQKAKAVLRDPRHA